jgi:hypothetical protein
MEEKKDTHRAESSPAGLIGCMLALAAAVAAAGLIAAAVVATTATTGSILVAVGIALGSMAGSCLLWAAGHLVRQQSRQAVLQERLLRMLGLLLEREEERPGGSTGPARATPHAAAEPPPLPPSTNDEVLRQLWEIGDALLLSEAERGEMRRRRRQRLVRQLEREVDAAVAEGDFAAAERRVETFADRLPGDEAAAAQRARIAAARDDSRRRELDDTRHRAEDLMALGRFADAETVAAGLTLRFPDAAEAAGLLEQVRRERGIFETERRRRLMREVERAAEKRQWREALRTSAAFLTAFPEGGDAEHIRSLRPTMEDNARLEEVREIRDGIRDLIARRRYAEALGLARDLVARFPDTRAAVELTRQLPRLEEMAKGTPR